MKTSSLSILLAPVLLGCLLLAGVAEGFTRVVALPRVSNLHEQHVTSESRLFGQALENPRQELLNNRHSASDWLYNMRSLPQSVVLREIRNPVISVFGWACFVSVVQRLMLSSKTNLLQIFATKLCIPGTAHSFLMSSLGLLLVFRTNSSYQRFNVRGKL